MLTGPFVEVRANQSILKSSCVHAVCCFRLCHPCSATRKIIVKVFFGTRTTLPVQESCPSGQTFQREYKPVTLFCVLGFWGFPKTNVVTNLLCRKLHWSTNECKTWRERKYFSNKCLSHSGKMQNFVLHKTRLTACCISDFGRESAL